MLTRRLVKQRSSSDRVTRGKGRLSRSMALELGAQAYDDGPRLSQYVRPIGSGLCLPTSSIGRPPTRFARHELLHKSDWCLAMHTATRLLVFAALVATCWPTWAGSTVTVSIGATQLDLPVPGGFVEPSAVAPDFRRLGELLALPLSRHVAIFVEPSAVPDILAKRPPKLTRYLVVQTFRADEHRTVPKGDFEEIKQVTRRLFKSLAPAAAQAAQFYLERQIGSQTAATGHVPPNVQFGEPVPLAIFNDTETTVSTLMLSSSSITQKGHSSKNLMVVATTTLLHRNKLLAMHAYTTFRSKEDIEWARKVSTEWSSTLLRLK